MGQLHGVLNPQQPLLNMSKMILREDHPQTLEMIQALTMTLWHLKRKDDALELEQTLPEGLRIFWAKQIPSPTPLPTSIASDLPKEQDWEIIPIEYVE